MNETLTPSPSAAPPGFAAHRPRPRARPGARTARGSPRFPPGPETPVRGPLKVPGRRCCLMPESHTPSMTVPSGAESSTEAGRVPARAPNRHPLARGPGTGPAAPAAGQPGPAGARGPRRPAAAWNPAVTSPALDQQDGRAGALGPADDVHAPVHPVGEVHVDEPGRAEHGPVTGGPAPEGVRARVPGPLVGLHLGQPDADRLALAGDRQRGSEQQRRGVQSPSLQRRPPIDRPRALIRGRRSSPKARSSAS